MIAPRPSARTLGRDLSPIAQRRQQMTDSPIARLYLGCPPWRSNAQEELPMSTPIQFRPVMIDVHPDDIAVAPELQVRHLRIPGNHRSRDAAQAALKDLLEWPQARAERAAYVCRGALVAFWGGGYRAAAAPKNAWTAAPGPLAPCQIGLKARGR
jgi:hypothetical protein